MMSQRHVVFAMDVPRTEPINKGFISSAKSEKTYVKNPFLFTEQLHSP